MPDNIAESLDNNADSVCLTASTVITDNSLQDMKIPGLFKITSSNGRMHVKTSVPHTVEYIMARAERMEKETAGDYGGDTMEIMAVWQRQQWDDMLTWTAKCVNLSVFPSYKRLSTGEPGITTAAKTIYSDEIKLLMTKPEFQRINMFEDNGAIAIQVIVKLQC